MSDVRKHVERLMGLQEERWNDPKYNELAASSELIARAYLAECEAHERTRNMMINYLRGVVETCGECRGKGFLMQMFTTTRLNPRCNKCFYERSLLASIEQKEGVSK